MTTMRPPGPFDAKLAVEVEDGISYPFSDGKLRWDNEYQAKAMSYVYTVLRAWFKDRDDVYSAMDMFIYYLRCDPTSVFTPDNFVVFGVDSKHPRMSWRAWNENGLLPSFILEVGSPNTHEYDAGDKRDLYARLGIKEYWRFDSLGNQFSPVLIGEQLVDGEYQRIDVHTDESGILRGYSPVLGLDLCVRTDGQLRFYDPFNQDWLRSYGELVAARREEAEARRMAEARLKAEVALREAVEARREETEARKRAEAEVRRLRALLARTNSGH